MFPRQRKTGLVDGQFISSYSERLLREHVFWVGVDMVKVPEDSTQSEQASPLPASQERVAWPWQMLWVGALTGGPRETL